jgi:alkylation response protein AidB-like acyl-CoA dehydrogenase
MTILDADDLAMLAAGFEGALRETEGTVAATSALFELGWADVLESSPAQAISTAFTALGVTGSSAAIADDVVAHALGLEVQAGTAVVLPAPGRATPPGRRQGDGIVVDGTVSRRLEVAERVVVPLAAAGEGVELVAVDPSALGVLGGGTIDPDPVHHRLRVALSGAAVAGVAGGGAWEDAVAAGRAALACQLLGAARTMLGLARDHAVDRVQFGRPISSFQAVRHKLAEALVQIEGAAAVTGEWTPGADPLLAALAKSLAGQAARTTAAHAQQVLAGIGFTADHPFHRWLKRTVVLDVLLGSSATLPAEIGAELLARGDAPRLVEL